MRLANRSLGGDTFLLKAPFNEKSYTRARGWSFVPARLNNPGLGRETAARFFCALPIAIYCDDGHGRQSSALKVIAARLAIIASCRRHTAGPITIAI